MSDSARFSAQGLGSEAVRTVLHIDPDATSRRVVAAQLGRWSYEVIGAAGYNEALRKADEQHFDAVLLEPRLPDGSGYDLIEPLRRSDPSLPVVVLTASVTEANRHQAATHDCSGFLGKPYTVAALAALLDEVISGRV